MMLQRLTLAIHLGVRGGTVAYFLSIGPSGIKRLANVGLPIYPD